MSNYRIVITKVEPNPNFAKEVEEFEKNNRFGRGDFNRYDVPGMPKENISTAVLMTELTDEQYKKVKAEVLKSFE